MPDTLRHHASQPNARIVRDVRAATDDAALLGDLPEWNLADLYAGTDAPELASDREEAARRARAFEERRKGRLTQALAAGELGEAVAEFEAIEELLGRIGSYAGLLYFGDTTDPARAKFYGDVNGFLTEVSAHLLFFPLELNALEEDALEKGMARDETLARYRPWIADLRLDKPYQLDERLERLFLEKAQTGASAWNRLFDETIAGLRFEVDGEALPLERALNLMSEGDPDTRRKGYEALAATFGAGVRTFGLITNTLAKDKEIADRWRGFEGLADSRHLANRVEREVVDALEAAVVKAYPDLSHRYYRLKARMMGADRLAIWDRNAPLPDRPEARIGWDEARRTVLSAYRGFAPEMSDIARRFFDEGWIDAPARPGKAPGAFAHPTVPSAHPFVLLNYLGKPRDVMTLAHELGHGVHQVLAASQGALMSQTPLTLAETASVFGEMLTFRSLLDATRDRTERRAMLAQKVEDMINTVVRQIAFYRFELGVHEARREGELTVEDIGAIWMRTQKEALGDAFDLPESYASFWSYVPHFVHSPFYVYAYAFGDCLVNSLYAVYREGGESGEAGGFEDKYFAMLRAGGTKHHSELLAPFGLDASDPDFWSRGLGVISGLIDELEGLVG